MNSPSREPLFDRLCPECGDKLHAKAVACACGWSQAPRSRASRQQQTVQFDQSCAWNDHGHTCHAPGVCSDTINGAGCWYCRKHWARLKGWPETPTVDTMTYRQRWYAERGLPFEPAKLGNFPPFQCVGHTDGIQMPPAKKVSREPGEDSDIDVYGEQAA